MKNKIILCLWFSFLLSLLFQTKINSQSYVLLGWNDLGMHCANKDFSRIAILPPYNNIYAQLVKRTPGQKPQLITSGVILEYSIPGNSYSAGKTNFWTYAQDLFGLTTPLPDNIGLTGKGLTGVLDCQGNYYSAKGIPTTPYRDTSLNKESPFQLIHIVAKDSATKVILTTTDVVIPISNEIGCVQPGCHPSEQSILDNHPVKQADFKPNGPNLCASCHPDNALGTVGDSGTMPLSEAIHHKHGGLGLPSTKETCYKCHPGPNTQCLRDVMSQNSMSPMICEDCHGTLDMIAHSISHDRRPWLDEPKCGSVECHGSLYSEQPGKLFRESQDHGGLFCSACHGSPHAILPSREANDNLQNIRLQGHAGTLENCTVCHGDNPVEEQGPHSLVTTANKNGNNIPVGFKLLQNYPNPFNPSTKIIYQMAKAGHVKIVVFNAMGKEVKKLVDEFQNSGIHKITFNAKGLSSGIYYYRILLNNYTDVKKMIYIK